MRLVAPAFRRGAERTLLLARRNSTSSEGQDKPRLPTCVDPVPLADEAVMREEDRGPPRLSFVRAAATPKQSQRPNFGHREVSGPTWLKAVGLTGWSSTSVWLSAVPDRRERAAAESAFRDSPPPVGHSDHMRLIVQVIHQRPRRSLQRLPHGREASRPNLRWWGLARSRAPMP